MKTKETIQKFRPIITTNDGIHEGEESRWVLVDRLACSPEEYLMIDVKDNGYMRCNNKFYILSAIISIEWKLIGEKEIYFKGNSYSTLLSDEVKYYEENLE